MSQSCKECKELRAKLAVTEAARETWKRLAADMREERDRARLLLEKAGQLMGGM